MKQKELHMRKLRGRNRNKKKRRKHSQAGAYRRWLLFFSLRFSSGLKNFGIFFVPVAQWKSVSLTRRRPRVRSEKDETLAGNTFFAAPNNGDRETHRPTRFPRSFGSSERVGGRKKAATRPPAGRFAAMPGAAAPGRCCSAVATFPTA